MSSSPARTVVKEAEPRVKRPRIAVVGGKAKIVRKARELGMDVLHVQYPDEYGPDQWPHVELALLVDYGDVDRLLPLVRAMHETYRIDQVVSLYELGLLPAARIADDLGMPGNPLRTVEMLLDKWLMRQHLNALGVSPVRAAVGRTEAELHAFIEESGLPVVVKPTQEAGSIGVFAVRDAAEVPAVVERFHGLAAAFNERDLVGDFASFLMEEYLDGPELSVETLSFDGRHVVVGVTDKVTDDSGFVEVGHSTPSRHPGTVLREAEQLTGRFLDAVGLVQGPAHTELKLTSRGPVVVESHNRIGGDRINELHEVACGVDMDRYALGWPLRLVEALTASPRPVAGAAIRFLTPQPGRVLDVSGVDEVRADPALVDLVVSARPGGEVVPLTWSDERAGHVIARGSTAAEAVANCERLVGMIEIRTERVR